MGRALAGAVGEPGDDGRRGEVEARVERGVEADAEEEELDGERGERHLREGGAEARDEERGEAGGGAGEGGQPPGAGPRRVSGRRQRGDRDAEEREGEGARDHAGAAPGKSLEAEAGRDRHGQHPEEAQAAVGAVAEERQRLHHLEERRHAQGGGEGRSPTQHDRQDAASERHRARDRHRQRGQPRPHRAQLVEIAPARALPRSLPRAAVNERLKNR